MTSKRNSMKIADALNIQWKAFEAYKHYLKAINSEIDIDKIQDEWAPLWFLQRFIKEQKGNMSKKIKKSRKVKSTKNVLSKKLQQLDSSNDCSTIEDERVGNLSTPNSPNSCVNGQKVTNRHSKQSCNAAIKKNSSLLTLNNTFPKETQTNGRKFKISEIPNALEARDIRQFKENLLKQLYPANFFDCKIALATKISKNRESFSILMNEDAGNNGNADQSIEFEKEKQIYMLSEESIVDNKPNEEFMKVINTIKVGSNHQSKLPQMFTSKKKLHNSFKQVKMQCLWSLEKAKGIESSKFTLIKRFCVFHIK